MPPQKRAPKTDLAALDHFRIEELPALVEQRRRGATAGKEERDGGKGKKKGATRGKKGTGKSAVEARDEDGEGGSEGERGGESQGWLELEELKRLMAWKLSRGTYRPALPGLIASNPAPLVRSATAQAYEIFASHQKSSPTATSSSAAKAILKPLLVLRGVGPATASLILSVAFPDEVPFFSDEVFAWLAAPEDGSLADREGSTGGPEVPPDLPKVKMRYNEKEFLEVWEGVNGVRERLEKNEVGREDGEKGLASAADVEKVAFVIGRLGGVWGKFWRDEKGKQEVEGFAEDETIGEGKGKGKKRKANGNSDDERGQVGKRRGKAG